MMVPQNHKEVIMDKKEKFKAKLAKAENNFSVLDGRYKKLKHEVDVLREELEKIEKERNGYEIRIQKIKEILSREG